MIEKPYKAFFDPSKSEVASKINRYSKRRFIFLFLEGTVKYGGRAKSKLTEGRYSLISKADGALLVHGPEKRKPINWQPPGCRVIAEVDNEILKITSFRDRPREKVTVTVSQPYVLILASLEKGEFTLWESEKEMVDLVFSNPTELEEGFQPLKKEAETPYGKIDLIGKGKEGELIICEFKRKKAQLSAVSQLQRYLQYFREQKRGEERMPRGILVSPGVSSSARQLLRKYDLEYKSLPPASAKNTTSLKKYFTNRGE